MRVTMLGTGTSAGTPVIGCDCSVCTSENPKNKRLRCGLKLEVGQAVVLVDTSTDLRQQALRFGLPRVDAVLYTHAHADHIFGADDLRIFNYRQRSAIRCYGSPFTLRSFRRTFSYVFERPEGGGVGARPRFHLVEVEEPFEVAGRRVVPVPVIHGDMEVSAYRFDSFAYVTDCGEIPPASLELLRGVEVLILGALRYRSHPAHLSVAQAVEVASEIGAGRTVLTHMNHEIDHEAPEVLLPRGVELGYDGLSFEIP